MKKFIAIVMICLMALCTVSCKGGDAETSTETVAGTETVEDADTNSAEDTESDTTVCQPSIELNS